MNNTVITILAYSLVNDFFLKNILPHIKDEYFKQKIEVETFSIIKNYFIRYKKLPTKNIMIAELDKLVDLSEEQYKEMTGLVSEIFSYDTDNFEYNWVYEETEEWCKSRALYNAATQSIEIIGDNRGNLNKTIIPKLYTDALAVSFNTSIGHDFFEDYEDRYAYYTNEETRVKTGLKTLDDINGGGIPRKTINLILAGTNVGKTAMLCNQAALYLDQQYNVLYISLEMDKLEIAKRIEGNLLDFDINDFRSLPRDQYDELTKVAYKNKGKLIVERMPSNITNVFTIKNFIEEIRIKKSIEFDVIIIDYIGILGTTGYKLGSNGINTNTYLKTVTEEVRNLNDEYDTIGWSAQQFNRSGQNASDPDVDKVADSFGMIQTSDFAMSLTTNERLQEMKQVYLKVLKTRYSNKFETSGFLLDADYNKMKFSDTSKPYAMEREDYEALEKQADQYTPPQLQNYDGLFDE